MLGDMVSCARKHAVSMPSPLLVPWGDHAVLADAPSHRLQVLNPGARLIYEALNDGLTPPVVARILVSAVGLSPEAAARDVEAVRQMTTPPRVRRAAAPSAAACTPPRRWAGETTYRLVGRPVRLRFGHARIQASVEPLMAGCLAAGATAAQRIDLFPVAGGLAVRSPGLPIGYASALDKALGQVLASAIDLLRPEARWIAVAHAAAVAWSGGVCVLAGRSGAGKTTLTAALVAAGFGYLTDDMAPLDGNTGRVYPMPFALALKGRSVPALRTRFPALVDAEVHRDGGRPRRYLDLSAAVPRGSKDGQPLRLLVFPAFRPGAPLEVVRITPQEAFARLLAARCWVSSMREDLNDLFALLDATPAYTLAYADLDAAVAACRGLADSAPGPWRMRGTARDEQVDESELPDRQGSA